MIAHPIARIGRAALGNWFYLLLPGLLFAAWSLSFTPEAMADPVMLERVLLVDFLISLPLLYALFLRGTLPPLRIALRCGGLALAGLWLAALLIPDGEGQVLPHLAWLRAIALPIIIAIELLALIAIVKLAFAAEPDEAKLASFNLPRPLIRLMILEARLWKWVWRKLNGHQ